MLFRYRRFFVLQSTLGWFAHPIYVDGDYPAVIKDLIAKKSEEMGLKESRLPTLTEEEKKLIKGKSAANSNG